jgi:hypothetical protein
MENDSDVTTLLKEIRGISHQLESNKSVYASLFEAKHCFYVYQQRDNDLNAQHLQNFKTIVADIEHFGGNIFYDNALINIKKEKDKKNINVDINDGNHSEEHYKKIVRNKIMAVAFLKRANTRCY